MQTREAFQALRTDYLERVERLAERLRPRFESGELVPWSEEDDRWETVRSIGEPKRPNSITYEEVPNAIIETACWRAVGKGDAAAALVLAVSPSTEETLARSRGRFDEPDSYSPASLRWGAAEAMAQDVIALAKRKGWLKAGRGALRRAA